MAHPGEAAGWGMQTPWHYADGTPVRVGDRLTVPGEAGPGTMRVRYNKGGTEKLYVSYNRNDRTFVAPIHTLLSDEGYMTRWEGDDRKYTDRRRPKKDVLPAGSYITSPFDYDHVMILNIR